METDNKPSTRSETSIKENYSDSRGFNKQEIIENNYFYKKLSILIGLVVLSGLTWFFWDDIKPFLNSIKKPDLGGIDDNDETIPNIRDYETEYNNYFKTLDENMEIYDLEVIRSQTSTTTYNYSEIELDHWNDGIKNVIT